MASRGRLSAALVLLAIVVLPRDAAAQLQQTPATKRAQNLPVRSRLNPVEGLGRDGFKKSRNGRISHEFTRNMFGGFSPRDIGSGGIASYVVRPRLMINNSSYSAPLRRLSVNNGVASMKYGVNQEDVDARVEEILNQDAPPESDYSRVILTEMYSQRRHLVKTGWAYFNDGEFRRARESFESALLVDSRAYVPRFGKFAVDVAQGHYRRAMTSLAEIMAYDQQRPPDAPGMFEYNFSLQIAFPNETELIELLIELRRFGQLNPQNFPVQGLVCYVMWYSRFPDAVLESSTIAARMAREPAAKNTHWGQFDRMIRQAQQKIYQQQIRLRQSPGS